MRSRRRPASTSDSCDCAAPPRAVQIAGPSGTWPVQCCAFDVLDGAVALNWENDAAARVTRLDALPGPFVWWLPQVLDAVGWQPG